MKTSWGNPLWQNRRWGFQEESLSQLQTAETKTTTFTILSVFKSQLQFSKLWETVKLNKIMHIDIFFGVSWLLSFTSQHSLFQVKIWGNFFQATVFFLKGSWNFGARAIIFRDRNVLGRFHQILKMYKNIFKKFP